MPSLPTTLHVSTPCLAVWTADRGRPDLAVFARNPLLWLLFQSPPLSLPIFPISVDIPAVSPLFCLRKIILILQSSAINQLLVAPNLPLTCHSELYTPQFAFQSLIFRFKAIIRANLSTSIVLDFTFKLCLLAISNLQSMGLILVGP